MHATSSVSRWLPKSAGSRCVRDGLQFAGRVEQQHVAWCTNRQILTCCSVMPDLPFASILVSASCLHLQQKLRGFHLLLQHAETNETVEIASQKCACPVAAELHVRIQSYDIPGFWKAFWHLKQAADCRFHLLGAAVMKAKNGVRVARVVLGALIHKGRV